MYEVKTWTAEVKAVDGAPEGTFTALVSVFGNVDSGGDRMMPGAFAKSLEDWSASGDPIPVIWSHDWDNPESHIGVVTKAVETADGLLVDARLDVQVNPKAAQVARLLKERRITQFSFGYRVTEQQVVDDPGSPFGKVRELSAVDLFEVGPTLLGMNEDTRLLQAASAMSGVKLGRPLNAKNEELVRTAHSALGEVLSGLEEPKSATVEAAPVETVEPVEAVEPVEEAAEPVEVVEAEPVEADAADAAALPPEVLSRLNELLIELRDAGTGDESVTV